MTFFNIDTNKTEEQTKPTFTLEKADGISFSIVGTDQLVQNISTYQYRFFIGDESKEWIKNNIKDYIFIHGLLETEKDSDNYYEDAVCLLEDDATLFKLTWC